MYVRIEAAVVWARGPVTVVGPAAAALHGSKWVDQDVPVELNCPPGRRCVPGIVVSRDRLADNEVCRVRGLPVTTPARTAFDLGRRLPLDQGVESVDALMNATGLKPADVDRVAYGHPGARGLTRLREVLASVDAGAESPPETRTRLLPACHALQESSRLQL